MKKALIIIRNYTLDPEDGSIIPNIPASATLQRDVNNMCVIWPRGRDNFPHEYLRCKIVAVHGPSSRCALAMYGDVNILRVIRDASPNSWTLAEIRTSSDPIAVAIRNNWIDDRPIGYDENGNPTGPIGSLIAIRGGYAAAEEGNGYFSNSAETTQNGDV